MPRNPEADALERVLAQIREIQQAIPPGQAQPTPIQPPQAVPPPAHGFVDLTRLAELRAIQSQPFDLSRLIRFCEELNICYANECYLAVPMLGRAILDHVPPIFGCKSFSEVANNYSGGTKSFKQSMEHLDNSLRKIADAQLHVQIRNSETLPNRTQVDFSADLDVLLAEIGRVLKKRTP